MPLSTQIKLFTLIGSVAALAALWGLYRYEYHQRERLESELSQMTAQRNDLLETLGQQTQRIQSFAALSQQYAKELKHAENAMDSLRDELRDNTKRLLVRTADAAAMCKADSARSLGDATHAQLSETAEQDYLRLREMIDKSQRQTAYLQHYIKTQCLD